MLKIAQFPDRLVSFCAPRKRGTQFYISSHILLEHFPARLENGREKEIRFRNLGFLDQFDLSFRVQANDFFCIVMKAGQLDLRRFPVFFPTLHAVKTIPVDPYGSRLDVPIVHIRLHPSGMDGVPALFLPRHQGAGTGSVRKKRRDGHRESGDQQHERQSFSQRVFPAGTLYQPPFSEQGLQFMQLG